MDRELLLKDDIQEFINLHINDDIPSLILKKEKFPNYPINEIAQQITSKRKAKMKLPTWYKAPGILYPPPVSIEQSSSEITAKYKAELFSGMSVLDLTGGFGVDSFYLSKSFEKLDYVEASMPLAEFVKHNFKVLEAENIQVHNNSAEAFLQSIGKSYDLIYIDPDRRPNQKRVRGFEESVPNLLKILPGLKAISSTILIKASPMMDISLAINQLGSVHTIIILAVENEVKELLFCASSTPRSMSTIRCVNLIDGKEESLEIDTSIEIQEECTYSQIEKYLYEPNAAIMKAQAFAAICNRYEIKKLHRNTSLFTAAEYRKDFPGRAFAVIKDVAYKKSEILPLLTNTKANISVRNFIDTPEQLKKKLSLNDGGDHYIFGYRNLNNKLRVAICKKAIK